jgi:xanthine/CO dehydrogenase XdhC/CoxF family maturation factor/YHS domain-containing protein
VFGETPVAETLARLGELTGFRTRLVTQAEVATLSLPETDAWGVVATMGHYDEDAAEAALAHPDLDVSLIASTRRAAAVRAELQARGLDERTLERLRTPAGKARGVTQEQIALLALAEIVTARQKRGPKVPVQETPPVVFATDPVCGMTVDPLTATHKAEFGGATFWFCSAGCQAEFEKTPERYLRPIEA